MQRRPLLDLLAALTLAASACTHAPPPATSQGRSDFLREQLAATDDDIKRAVIKDELAKVELQRAREVNTVFAYRRFLAEFPGGEESTTARALLEQLRFEEAKRTDTRTGWEAFLEEHPRGRKTSEARQALGALEIADAIASPDLALTRRVLGRYPDHPQRPQLVAHEDDLAWTAASGAGADAAQAYLNEHPAGAHRLEALARKDALDVEQLLSSEDRQKAEQRAQAGDAQDAQRRTLAEMDLRLALQALDVEALRKLAQPPTPAGAEAVRDQAAAFLASLERVPLTADVQAAVAAARPGAGLPTRAQLLDTLKTAEPLARVDALRQLAEWNDPADVDTALDQLESRYVGVRLGAIDLLRALSSHLKPEVWTRLSQAREQDALGKALSATPWRRVAALRDASGRTDLALAAWHEVERNDPNDLSARARLVALEKQVGDRLAYASAVRELARSAASFGDERWLAPADPQSPEEQRKSDGQLVGLSAELTLLRQLCTAIDLEASASEALLALRQAAAPAEQELLGLALTDAERVLRRLQSKKTELEGESRRRDKTFVACGSDPSAAAIKASRETRRAAIAKLGELGDRRVLEFVTSLRFAASTEVREAAIAAEAKLKNAPSEPPAPPPPAVEMPVKKPGKRR